MKKFIQKTMAIFVSMLIILNIAMPNVAKAIETEESKEEIVLYDGLTTSRLTYNQIMALDYLEEIGKLKTDSEGTASADYYNESNKKLFSVALVEGSQEPDYKITLADNVTASENITYIVDKTSKATKDYYGEMPIPDKIYLIFDPTGEYSTVTINIYDGIDIDTMTNRETACMTYLFISGVLYYPNDDFELISYSATGKELMYFESEESTILHICDGVSSKDNIEVNVVANVGNVGPMFSYYNTSIPQKIKLNFKLNNVLKGDLDGNGVVDANDASIALELNKTEKWTQEDILVGDMDDNNVIDANDASLILEVYKLNN